MKGLPPYVHCKMAKGRAYYYFAYPGADERGKFNLARLPNIDDPQFAEAVRRLTEANPRRLPPPKRQEPQETKVYFIGGATGPIKIGFALRPRMRLKTLQVGSVESLALLATLPGGAAEEKAYHDRFAEHRLRGEWFARHPAILAEIERVNKCSI